MGNSWLNAIWRETKTVGGSRLVLLAIADRADGDGFAYCSYEDIAERANITIRQAKRIVRSLSGDRGPLLVIRGGGASRVNGYVVRGDRDKGDVAAAVGRGRKKLARLAEGKRARKGDIADTVSNGDTGDTVDRKTVTSAPQKGDISNTETVTSEPQNGDIGSGGTVTPATPEPLEPLEPQQQNPREPQGGNGEFVTAAAGDSGSRGLDLTEQGHAAQRLLRGIGISDYDAADLAACYPLGRIERAVEIARERSNRNPGGAVRSLLKKGVA